MLDDEIELGLQFSNVLDLMLCGLGG